LNYQFGKIHGPYTSWHENGEPEKSGDYKSGAKYGDWNYWDNNGKKIINN
jgi:antitoxin component YwqK of YwqJK toxin-antitoxin module